MGVRKDPNKIKKSAQTLIAYILDVNRSEVDDSHLKEILSVLIWKITESEGKYTLRYISEGAKTEKNKKNLVHEHVHERSKLISELLERKIPLELILENAIACLVTKEEHQRLNKVDKRLEGWKRYEAADIKVFEASSGIQLSFNKETKAS